MINKLFLFSLLFTLVTPMHSQQVFLKPLTSTQKIKLYEAVKKTKEYLLCTDPVDSSMAEIFTEWLDSVHFATGYFAPAANSQVQIYIFENELTSFFIIPDSCISLFSKNHSMLALPESFPTKRYVFIKESVLAKESPDYLGLSILHEFAHLYQFKYRRSEFFDPTDTQRVIKREIHSRNFELRTLYTTNPELKKVLPRCNCKSRLAEQIDVFLKRNELPHWVVSLLFFEQCPKELLTLLGYR